MTTTEDNEARGALTADQLEAIFHRALGAGDTEGVRVSLTLMASADPRRAQRLYDALDRWRAA